MRTSSLYSFTDTPRGRLYHRRCYRRRRTVELVFVGISLTTRSYDLRDKGVVSAVILLYCCCVGRLKIFFNSLMKLCEIGDERSINEHYDLRV